MEQKRTRISFNGEQLNFSKLNKSCDKVVQDLHGKRTTEVKTAVLNSISKAYIADSETIVLIHGYNGGGNLRHAIHQYLEELKQQGTVRNYEVNPANPGETIVLL